MSNLNAKNTKIIICHHAGGSSLKYRKLFSDVYSNVDFLSIDLPGRAAEISAPLTNDLLEIVSHIHEICVPYLESEFILYGHSMGGLIMYEYGRFLEKEISKMPISLIASCCMPPSMFPEIKHLIQSNSTNSEIHEVMKLLSPEYDSISFDEKSLKYFFDLIRGDYQILENYTYSQQKVSFPIDVVTSSDDPITNGVNLSGWTSETINVVNFSEIEGGHFSVFDKKNFSLISNIINEYIDVFIK